MAGNEPHFKVWLVGLAPFFVFKIHREFVLNRVETFRINFIFFSLIHPQSSAFGSVAAMKFRHKREAYA